jgi:hypothetical protein
LELVQADKEGEFFLLALHPPPDSVPGYVKTYIVLPSSIYGLATGPLVDAGIQNPSSIQIPWTIGAALDRGQVGMVGPGKNIWPNVHIDDGKVFLHPSVL